MNEYGDFISNFPIKEAVTDSETTEAVAGYDNSHSNDFCPRQPSCPFWAEGYAACCRTVCG